MAPLMQTNLLGKWLVLHRHGVCRVTKVHTGLRR